MKHSWIIALNTFRESIRNRIIINIFIFAFFIFLLGLAIGNWSLGEQLKVITDFGLTGLHFVALLIVIFVGVSLVSREIDSRTIYNTLSKGIYRHEFLLGKFIGLSLTLFINVLLLGLILMAILFLYTGRLSPGLFVPVGFIYMEMLLILSVSVLFSVFTNATLSAMMTIAVYISGHMFQSVSEFLHKVRPEQQDMLIKALQQILGAISWVLPNFSLFNITAEYVHGAPVSAAHQFYVYAYGLAHLTLILLVSVMIFSKKDLK